MKTSYRRLLIFGQVAQAYLAQHSEQTKMRHAVERVLSQLQSIQSDFQSKLVDLDIDHCSVDDRGNILRDERDNLQFTKENFKLRNKSREEILDREDVEVEPHYCSEMPELSPLESQAFAGFVLREVTELKAAS